jgi:formate dehydrogenase alpha subunit
LETIHLTIDGVPVTASKGVTVFEAAQKAGIYIPNLCHDPDLQPYGACRLCVVEIEGMRGLPTSCTTPAADGMVVHTYTPAANDVRRTVLELLVSEHGADCLVCRKNQRCDLQKVAAYVGLNQQKYQRNNGGIPIDDSNPFFFFNPNQCVFCAKCIRTCDEIASIGAIDFNWRGYTSKVSTFGDKPLIESVCVSCGECVVRCPVNALLPKSAVQPKTETKSVCPYCGVGCGMYLGVFDGKIVSVRGDRANPVNKGRLCVKGRFGISDFVNHKDRLTKPLIKRDGKFVEASWDEVLNLVADRLKHYKGDQFAGVASAKVTNEDNYVFQKFVRAVMGTNNLDHCARLCHAPTVAGLAKSFGSGAMTNPIGDLSSAGCILAIGTNTTEAHPIIGMDVKKAVRRGARLIVANPKEIELCRFATIWLRHRPGTDVALILAMIKTILVEGLADEAFVKERCEGFDELKRSVDQLDITELAHITGVPAVLIAKAARIYAQAESSSILYAMGITQHSHGTDNVLALANLAMLTGNIGRPGTGVNALRGQNNVQGACDMGCLPNVLPGYQRVDELEVRRHFEQAWGSSLSDKPGLTLTEMFDAALSGRIKAMYLMGENPLLSDPDARHVEGALKHLDFLVAQDVFLTETALLADVVLPAASFAEKDGTFTNTERRVQRLHKAVNPPGEARPDWSVLCQVASKMGAPGFGFDSPEAIMREIASVTPSYRGITYARIEAAGIQWPCPDASHPGTPVLHTQRFATPSGKGRFFSVQYIPPSERPDKDYPLTLTTDRSLFQYHTGTMTRKVAGLNVLRKEELLEINAEDAQLLGINDGDIVRITSRRGAVETRVRVGEICPQGVVSLTFHFAETPTNRITNPALDPVAKIAELKVSAVRVEKLKSDSSR